MKSKAYKARVNARSFLNLPGFHEGAYVVAYVEDTSERGLAREDYGAKAFHNPRPRVILEIADCSERINLEFDVHSKLQRQNSLHKIDTLVEALGQLRQGLVTEAAEFQDRQQQLKKKNKNKKKGKKN